MQQARGECMKGRKEEKALLPGTLEMLILQTLRRGALHGYAIAQHIQQTSEDVLQVEEGSLYPALQCLLVVGLTARNSVTRQGNRTTAEPHGGGTRLKSAGRTYASDAAF